MPMTGQIWARLRPRASNSILVSHRGSRGSNTRAIFYCLTGARTENWIYYTDGT